MNRPMGLTDQTNPLTVVSGVTYGPAGEMKTIDYGAINESRTYNSLLQLKTISAFNVGLGQTVFGRLYTYSGTNNNGKIQSETDTMSAEVVTYQYDALNRLIQATGTGWGQSFVYDGFGNLMDKNITGTAPPYHTSFDTTHNWDNSVPYDKNGNQLATSTEFFGYDVENRMVTANPTGVEDVYAYGRGNRRVYAGHWHYDGSKYDLDSETVYFYSVTGQKLGTYQLHLNTAPPGPPSLTFTLQETRVWFGGRLVMLNGQTVTPDRLGSFGKYYPFGEDRGSGNPPGDREKFATYTRDSDTNLDYAVNRYYNNVSGRFLSADPYMANNGDAGDPSDPGSWNRYAYTRSDPINRLDPGGLQDCSAGVDFCTTVTSSSPDGNAGGGHPPGPNPIQGNDPSSGYPGRVSRQAIISRAKTLAEQWLSKSDCQKLFNVSGGGFDPQQVLSSLISSGSYASGSPQIRMFTFNIGTSYFGGFTLPNISANISTTGISFGMGADIVINTAGVSVAADDRQGLSEFVADAAETILEELGHAYNYAAGSGGSSIVYDVPGVSSYKDPATGKTIDAGLHNYLTIMGNCNK